MTKFFFTLVLCAQAEWEGEPNRNFVLGEATSLILDCLVLLSKQTNPMLDYRLRWSRRSFYNGNIGTIWDRARRRFQLR